INSPTSTGRDSSCKGGSVSGEITSPRFVNTVRYQGKLKMSPASMPTSTGREVRRSGGNFSGDKVSRSWSSKRNGRGRFQASGSKRSSSGPSDKLDDSGFFSSDDPGLLSSENICSLEAFKSSTDFSGCKYSLNGLPVCWKPGCKEK